MNPTILHSLKKTIWVSIIICLFSGCGPEGCNEEEPTTPNWNEIKASYEKVGYRFVSDFKELIGSVYSFDTPEGPIQFTLKEIEMAVNQEGQLAPIVLKGPALNQDMLINVDNKEWAIEQGFQTVTNLKNHVMFLGKNQLRITVSDYEFGIDPNNNIFSAFFTGVEIASGDTVSYQFATTLSPPTFSAIECQLVPASFCVPYGTCNTCTVVTDAAGNQTGCTCPNTLGFCLWFTQDCRNVTCTRTCIVIKAFNIYTCNC